MLCLLFSVIKTPFADGSVEYGEFEDLSGSVSRISRPFTSDETFNITKAAIAGVVGENAKEFVPGKNILKFYTQ